MDYAQKQIGIPLKNLPGLRMRCRANAGQNRRRVSILDLADPTLAKDNLTAARRCASSAPRSTVDYPSWTTLGTTTTGRARSGWEGTGDGYRKAFVATKVDGRTKKEAARQLDQSLSVSAWTMDLLQHHEIIRFDDVDRIFAEGGAMEAFLEARKAGKIRYIGFTGHKDPQVHLYMLQTAKQRGFKFDTVQMPLNVMDAHFRSFQKQVLPVLVKENIGVLGMKSMGDGVVLKSNVVTPTECLRYALSLPVSVVITGIDSMDILDQAFTVARTFTPLTRQQITRLLAKTAPVASRGEYELFKTTSHFDSTAHNPEWLGEEPSRVKALAGD